MKYFSLPNLSSREAKTAGNIAEQKGAADFPADKSEYDVWKSQPTTEHVFYNCTEGLYPTLRVDVDNPPKFLHGFVCEYDADIDEATVAKIPKNGTAGLLPTWVSRSRFRNGRKLVFEFAEPVFVDNSQIAERFITLLAKETKIKNLLPGLDGNFTKLTQYQELGLDWKKIGEPIKSDLLSAIFFKAAGAKTIESAGLQIPMERIAEEVDKRWGGKWPGEFVEGARGPLFWVEPFVDRVGCQVGEFGMICYSDRAGKSFVTWPEILGHEFVRNFEAACLGRAIEGVWFDGTVYWTKLESGIFASHKKEDIAADLKIRNHLKSPQVEEALSIVRNSHRVIGTFPFIHNKNEIVSDESGGLFLNTSRKKLLPPATEDGEFPWLKNWMENAWGSPEEIQRDTFLAWFQRLYVTSLQGNMAAGQAIVISGKPGIGKTLLSRKIVGAALGGYMDASSFLLDKTSFNRGCCENAIWSCDDQMAGVDWHARDAFGNSVKKYIANPQIPYHKKYSDEEMVTWRGRIIITTNTDLKSLDILPDLDDSIQEKIILLRLSDTFLPSFKDIEEVIRRELPFFLRWITEWNCPSYILGGDRFGIKHYHHPELLQACTDAAPHGQLGEMLDYAIKHALPNDTKAKEKWFTAVEIRALLDTPGLRSGLAKFAGNRLGISLSRLGVERIKATRIQRGVKQYLVNLI